MARLNDSPGEQLRRMWQRLSPLPGGRWLFSRLLGRSVPYTGTVRARVEVFDIGRVRVSMNDRRGVRNHLKSIHAIAIANLGELATGLALLGAMGSDVRGILTGLDVTYTKKARGTLHVDVSVTIPSVAATMDHPVEAAVVDAAGDTVARVVARWRLSPRPSP